MDRFFNSNLKYIRKKYGISQQELANKIGKDRSSIAYWENGKADITLENVIKLSEVLNIPIHDLVGKDLTLDQKEKK